METRIINLTELMEHLDVYRNRSDGAQAVAVQRRYDLPVNTANRIWIPRTELKFYAHELGGMEFFLSGTGVPQVSSYKRFKGDSGNKEDFRQLELPKGSIVLFSRVDGEENGHKFYFTSYGIVYYRDPFYRDQLDVETIKELEDEFGPARCVGFSGGSIGGYQW